MLVCPGPDQQDLCLAQLRLLRFFNSSAVHAVLWALDQQRMGRNA